MAASHFKGHPQGDKPPHTKKTHAEHMYIYVRTRYGRKASKASPAKRSEPVWTAMHITHA